MSMHHTQQDTVYYGPTFSQRCVYWFAAFSILFSTTTSIAQAQQASPQVVVDPNVAGPHPTLDHTQNGLNQVNIATPNSAGVSHNSFTQYGVPERGIILNNALHHTTTKIGGAITGNANLQGHPAGVILNEVTGALPSQILGYTEVAGHQAAVVIANPNGITCNGCGFINTTRSTLATGRPQFDRQGNISQFSVQRGNVTFAGKGGDFSTVPVLDILSRTVTLNAQVNAQTANIVLGRNNIDYGTNKANPLAADGHKSPEFALDTAAMGGLYANRIYMVVNEAGAGVRVNNAMAANAGDMTLTTQGDLVLNGSMAAAGAIRTHVSGETINHGTLRSQADAVLASNGTITNTGVIASHQANASLTSRAEIYNSGGIGAAGGDLRMKAYRIANTGTMAARDTLTARVSTRKKTVSEFVNTGHILSGKQAFVASSGDIINTASVIAQQGDVTFNTQGGLTNSGTIASRGGQISLTAQGIVTNSGKVVAAGGGLTANAAQLINDGAVFAARDAVAVSALQGFSNKGGQVSSDQGAVSLTSSGDIDTTNGSLVSTQGDMRLSGRSLLAQSATVQAGKALNATLSGRYQSDASTVLWGQNTLTLVSEDGVANQGLIRSQGDVALRTSGDLINAGSIVSPGGGVSLTAQGIVTNSGKVVAAGGGLTANAAQLINDGAVFAARDAVAVSALQGFSNKGGQVSSDQGAVSLTSSGDIDTTNGSLVSTQGDMRLSGRSLLAQSATVQAGKALNATLSGGYQSNFSSVVWAREGLTMAAGQGVVNNNLLGGSTITVKGASFLNGPFAQVIGDNGPIVLTATGLGGVANNNSIRAHGSVALTSQGALINTGVITSQTGSVQLSSQGALLNHGGIGASVGSVAAQAQQLTNSGKILAHHGTTLESDSNITNIDSQIINDTGTVVIKAVNALDNSHGVILNQGGNAILSVGDVLNNSGAIQTSGSLSVNSMGSYQSDSASSVWAQGPLTVIARDDVTNNGLLGGGGALIQSASLLNGAHANLIGETGAVTVNSLVRVENDGIVEGAQVFLQGMSVLNNTGARLVGKHGATTLMSTGTSGITNAGLVAAQGNGAVLQLSGASITNNGKLLSSGVVAAQSTQDTVNANLIYGEKGVRITAGGQFVNRAQLGADSDTLGIVAPIIDNRHGLLQSYGDLALKGGTILNSQGKIFQRGSSNTLSLSRNNRGEPASFDNTNGTFEALGNLALSVISLQGMPSVVSGRNMTVHVANDVNNVLFQSGGDATLTIDGTYHATAGNGLIAAGNATVNAADITSEGALLAQGGALTIQSGKDLHNTGLLMGATGVQIVLPGDVANVQGAVLTQNGSISVAGPGGGASHSVLNSSGQITASGAQSDLTIHADSVTNNVLGGVSSYHRTNDGKDKPVFSNSSGTLTRDVLIPQGLLNSKGEQGTGYVTIHANSGKHRHRRGGFGIYKEEDLHTLKNAAPVLSSGRDIYLSTTGQVENNAGHIAAGRNIVVSGGALNNIGYEGDRYFQVHYWDRRGAWWDNSHTDVPLIGSIPWIGHRATRHSVTWGNKISFPDQAGTIIAGNSIIGSLTGAITNQTKIEHGEVGATTRFTGATPAGLSVSPQQTSPDTLTRSHGGLSDYQGSGLLHVKETALEQQGSVALPGMAPLGVVTPPATRIPGLLARQLAPPSQRPSAGAQSYVVSSQGRPLANGVQSAQLTATSLSPAYQASLSNVVAAIPGGQALFVPNPSPQPHYFIETNPQYATLAGLYGSQYLVNRLSQNPQNYQFLGDNTFDTQYVQQQILGSTGQTFLGPEYQNANQQMHTLLDQANAEAQRQHLEFGEALTPAQQAALKQNIVWYVPAQVNGRTVLAPRLYMAPDQVTLSDGGTISAKHVALESGDDLSNTGTIQGDDRLSLESHNGDVVNAGGTLSGGDLALTALKGSLRNESQLTSYQVFGGSQQELSSQGQISASGAATLEAAHDIAFSGAHLNAGGATTMVAGHDIALDAAAAQSSTDQHYHHYTHQANDTKNFGSSVESTGTLVMDAQGGAITLTGSGVTSSQSAILQAKGNITLNTVTDHRYDYTRRVSHGFMSKKTVTQSSSTSSEIGGLVAAQHDVTMASGGNMALAGTVNGGGNTRLISGGALTVDPLKNTSHAFYEKKKSGLAASFKGGSFSVGFGHAKSSTEDDGTSWTPSALSAGTGNLQLTSQDATRIKGSDLSAGKNIQINASSILLDDVLNHQSHTQKSKSSYVGVSVGTVASSMIGQAVRGGKNDPRPQRQAEGALRTENAINMGSMLADQSGSVLPNGAPLMSVGSLLMGGQVSVGFSKQKSYAQQTSSRVQGDHLQAGDTVALIARGQAGSHDATSGSIKAVSSQIEAQDIALEAQKNLKLQSDWDTTSSQSHSHSSGLSAGLSISSVLDGLAVGKRNARQQAKGDSATAVVTQLNARKNITLTALNGDATLSGASVIAGQSVGVQAKGDIALQAVTNHQTSFSSGSKSTLMSRKKEVDDSTSTHEVGNTLKANDTVALSSGGNTSLAGTLEGGKDVSVRAGGQVVVNALKDTAYSFKERKKSGFSAGFSGGQASLGFGKSNDRSTVHATNWHGSDLSADTHDLGIHSGGATTITSSSLEAGHDLGINASSVAFKALSDTLSQTQSHKSSFVGLTAGLSQNSIAGQALQSVLGALQSSGKGSTLLRALNAAQGGEAVGSGIYSNLNANVAHYPSAASASKADKSGAGANLIGVQVNVGFNKSKATSTQTTQTVQGAQAIAGNDLSLTARGDRSRDPVNGDIALTASQLLGRNVGLDAAHNLTLQAGWNHSDSEMRSRQSSGSLGVDANVGLKGWGEGVEGSIQTQKQHVESHSSSAVDSTVSAQNQVSLRAHDRTRLNGAEVNGERIDVKTGQLEITSPQNTSSYKSTSTQAGGQFSVPIPIPGTVETNAGGGGSYAHQTVRDHYASTEKTLSGFYAGRGGLGIDVSGNTTLNAGVLSSRADRSQNHLTTHHLTANDEHNASAWTATSIGGGASIGTSTLGSTEGILGAVGQGMAANSLGMLGGQRDHNEHSESQSAISGNITVRAQSQSGHYITDVSQADKALENRFDAQKLSNQLEASRIGTQLVGKVVGEIADKLGPYTDKNGVHHKGVLPGFDEEHLQNNWARIALETAGNAGIAAATGGNVGAAAGATIAGKISGGLASYPVGYEVGRLLGASNGEEVIANLVNNSIAAGAGAAIGGLITGSGRGIINGASIASIINQYNDTAAGDIKRALAQGVEAQYIEDVRRSELRHHVATAYLDGFDSTNPFWQANGEIGGEVPDEYELPTDDDLRSVGIDGVSELKKLLYHPIDSATGKNSGLEAVLYFPKDSANEETPPLLVFKGTTNWREAFEDFLQFSGLDSFSRILNGGGEYAAVEGLASRLRDTPLMKHLVVGGNSLGGGLATDFSENTGIRAVATNPAEVNMVTDAENKILTDAANKILGTNTYRNNYNGVGQIDQVYIKGEFLHLLQNGTHYIFSGSPGLDRFFPYSASDATKGISVSYIPPSKIDRSVDFLNALGKYHGIDFVKRAIDEQFHEKWNDIKNRLH